MIRLEAASAAVPGAAGGEPRIVLRDLEGSFQPGEIHRILGANGSGKSTLIRILAGLQAPASGRVLLDGEPVSRRASRWPRVAVLFEEPDPQFLTDSVEAEIAFGLESLGWPVSEIRARTREALRGLDLEPFERRDPLTLSGGEKARVLLAAALAARPGAILLDQALAHLDGETRREIEARLAHEASSRGLLVVHARQGLEAIRSGERVHEIRGGMLVPFEEDASLAGVEVGGADAWARGRSQRRDTRAAGEVAVALEGVTWGPRGRAAGGFAVRKVTLEVRLGETVALVGRSGSGKTTILKLAAGLLEPSSGSVRIPMDASARGGEARDSAPSRATGLALEYPERQLFGRTVGEDVAALLWVEGIPEAERRSRARIAMHSVGLDPPRFEDRAPATLSEGEKRRAALAALLADPPRAILLDEPTAGLDPEGRRALAEALDGCRSRGHAVLLASHDLEFVARVADRVVPVGLDAGPGEVQGEERVGDDGSKGDAVRDTTSEASAIQLDVYRKMSGAERLEIAMQLSRDARAFAMARLREANPRWSDQDLHRELIRIALLPEPLPPALR